MYIMVKTKVFRVPRAAGNAAEEAPLGPCTSALGRPPLVTSATHATGGQSEGPLCKLQAQESSFISIFPSIKNSRGQKALLSLKKI